MSKDIRVLFEQFKNMPFPELGKVIGDFAFYDSLMAGTVSSFLGGAIIAPDDIPTPDHESVETLNVLKEKATPSEQERYFLKYAQLLDELRAETVRAVLVQRKS